MIKHKKMSIRVCLVVVLSLVFTMAFSNQFFTNEVEAAATLLPEFAISCTQNWSSNDNKFSQYEASIDNLGTKAIKNWEISVDVGKEASIDASWSMDYTLEDGILTIRGVEYNSKILLKSRTTFGFILKNGNDFGISDVKFSIDNALYMENGEVVEPTEEPIVDDDPSKPTKAPKTENNRYYPETMSVEEIKDAATNMPRSEVKQTIFKEIDEHWDAISYYFNQTDKKKVYCLFLGLATRESTLNCGCETAQESGFGVNPAHAYGAFQTAVTAFDGCDPTFDQEDDVDELFQYKLTEKNFFDPYISNHMGIRKLIHFVKEGEEQGLTGVEIVRGALKGFNTGHADYIPEQEYYTGYSDEIAALGGWYYANEHFDDDVFTWTGDQRVDRSDPWGWWLAND